MNKLEINKIVALHGWAYETEKWKPFLRKLELSGISASILKIPGLTSKLDEVWTMKDYVDWLSGKLQGKKNLVLLGHSFGGHLALRYTSRYSSQIASLILVDSSGIKDNSLFMKTKRAVFLVLAKMGKLVFKKEAFRKILYKLTRERDYFEANPTMRQTMRNVARDDVRPFLELINVPTCIIWGEKDSVVPKRFSNILYKEIRGSKLNIVSGAKHSPQFTHKDKVVEIIKEFLT